MRTRRYAILAGVAVAATGLALTTVARARNASDRSYAVRRAIDAHRARNVILFLGDGTG